jgi:ketosteroid isomerase-like protein
MKRITTLLVFILLSACSFAKVSGDAMKEMEVRRTLTTFIHAFNDLDWDTFRSAFADDATVFFPRAYPERADGRLEFERNFRKVFEQIRGGRANAPYMNLQPQKLKIQIIGEVAIVTLQLDDRPNFLNRRTVILRKLARGWKIIHLHASEVSTPSP